MLTLLESDIDYINDLSTLRRIHLRSKASLSAALKKVKEDPTVNQIPSVAHLISEAALVDKIEAIMAARASKIAAKTTQAKKAKRTRLDQPAMPLK